MFNRFIAVPWYGLAVLSGFAAAQPAALTYDSPYAIYRPYQDEPLASWRAANDEVARASSHASSGGDGHGAGAQPDASREYQPPARAPAPAHGHH